MYHSNNALYSTSRHILMLDLVEKRTGNTHVHSRAIVCTRSDVFNFAHRMHTFVVNHLAEHDMFSVQEWRWLCCNEKLCQHSGQCRT